MIWRGHVRTRATFQLTASRRGWLLSRAYRWIFQHFNSQPHEEADQKDKKIEENFEHFNSQPHEEADWRRWKKWVLIRLFQLTASRRGWQRNGTERRNKNGISTHSLTKRLTFITFRKTWLISFQLTASRRGWRTGAMRWDYRTLYFNSQPHEEADGNFRQKYIYLKLFFTLIAHINLVFYSNHYIVNFFLVKYTHFLVRMSWSISVSLPFAL